MKTRRPHRALLLAALAAAVVIAIAGCGAKAEQGTTNPPSEPGVRIDTSPEQEGRVRVETDAEAAALLPPAVAQRATLTVGGGWGAGNPPLGFAADDNTTPIGIEVDLAYLVANKLGLKVKLEATSWENLFVGLDSGKFDVGFSNITVTEERKEKYDFATYRKDNIAVEAKKGSGWTVRSGKDIAGKKIAVSSGTNQEKILLEWDAANVKAGLEKAEVKYYQNQPDTYLALSSGRIDGYLAPSPSVAYHVATSGQTDSIGTFSGAGDSLQGLIAATTKKDSGLVKALAAALNSAIKDGSYGKVLERWNVASEALDDSVINPPGLPKKRSS